MGPPAEADEENTRCETLDSFKAQHGSAGVSVCVCVECRCAENKHNSIVRTNVM